jgi:hypothetical protein
MTDQPRRHRRFQFRLRTLMIVVAVPAVPCAYVGWQAKIVRERKEWVREYSHFALANPIYDLIQRPMVKQASGDLSHGPSFIRRCLGDQLFPMAILPKDTSSSEIKVAATLFPEADIFTLK